MDCTYWISGFPSPAISCEVITVRPRPELPSGPELTLSGDGVEGGRHTLAPPWNSAKVLAVVVLEPCEDVVFDYDTSIVTHTAAVVVATAAAIVLQGMLYKDDRHKTDNIRAFAPLFPNPA